jgi:glycolate oxidase FAD binding subunit
VTASLTSIRPQSARDVRTAMLDAITARERVRIVGAGTWLHGGAPLAGERTLSLRGVTGIEAYVPGDLTITAHAGTTLAELAHTTAVHGQWLGLDPAGSPDGTIGATVATASAGPLSHAFGTPRDLVLGLEAVTGYGEVIKPGGRVVKNVAGFDLVRLYTGSCGTLGPITSVTLRLRALPVHDVTFALPVSLPDVSRVLAELRQPTLSLMACEWIDVHAAQRIGVPTHEDIVLVRLGGNDAFVRGQTERLRAIVPIIECAPRVWGALATLDADAACVVRVHGTIAALPARIERVRTVVQRHGATAAMHARVSSGMVRFATSATHATTLLNALRTADAGRVVPEVAPTGVWLAEADAFASGLAGRVRDAFDPWQVCNRREPSHA